MTLVWSTLYAKNEFGEQILNRFIDGISTANSFLEIILYFYGSYCETSIEINWSKAMLRFLPYQVPIHMMLQKQNP